LFSCTSDVKFSNPGFQARKDNFIWKADVNQGNISNGFLTLKAYKGSEFVTIKVPAPLSAVYKNNPLVFRLGITQNDPFNDSEASFTTTVEGVVLNYVTNTEVSNGQFAITSFDFTTKKISGTFRFNATYQGIDPLIAKNVNFQEGFIFEVQVF
jgi:hypothetical protein